jgi:hypothetical protein
MMYSSILIEQEDRLLDDHPIAMMQDMYQFEL